MIHFAPNADLIRPEVLNKLEGFRNLPVGWHYAKGGPITAEQVDIAKATYRTLSSVGFFKVDAFAGADGEVLLTASHRLHYVSITLNPDGLHELTHEDGQRECCFLEEADLAQIKDKVRAVAREIWGISDSFTQTTSSTIGGSSMIYHSRTLATAACLFLRSNAQRARAA